MNKLISSFFLLLITKTAILEDIKDMNINNLAILAEDVTQIRPDDVLQSDVAFYLITRNDSQLLIPIIDNSTEIDTTKATKIIIHGWIENHKRSWYKAITTEYLINDDFNIIQVDWERVARSSYISSAINTKLVGNYIGAFILTRNLSLNKIHIIGHSLGAHIAAFAAKKVQQITNQKIFRITALDPAGPYFREFFITKNNRLNRDDAEIVDAIHTDGGFYGYENAIGTLDIFVNGGVREQPGCLTKAKVLIVVNSVGEFIQNSFCSHARSVNYFIESINNGTFACRKCATWTKFVLGQCNSNDNYVISAENVTGNMTGICFTNTNSNPPYLGNHRTIISKEKEEII